MNSFNINEKKLINKGFALIKEIGWNNFDIKTLSKKEKISEEEIKFFFSCKYSLIERFIKMIDSEVESNLSLDEMRESSVKDNLFEVIMLRFDVMEPYKIELSELIKNATKNPALFSVISKNVINSMDFYLEISNSYKGLTIDLFKKNFLFIIYSYTFKIWLEDNSDDLSKTMAALDKSLSIADNLQKKAKDFLPI